MNKFLPIMIVTSMHNVISTLERGIGIGNEVVLRFRYRVNYLGQGIT